MIRFQWNALRAGDRVRMHADGGGLTDGVVALVAVRKGSNEIGVRVTPPGGEAKVFWPSRMAVHNEAGDVDEPCSHCPLPVAQEPARI